MTEEEIRIAKEAEAEYHRRYRKENPEKMREIRLRYWAKKAKQQQAENNAEK